MTEAGDPALVIRGASWTKLTQHLPPRADLSNHVTTVIATLVTDPTWSPDGKYLVASAGDGLVIFDMQGKSRTLIRGGVGGPAWQPLR